MNIHTAAFVLASDLLTPILPPDEYADFRSDIDAAQDAISESDLTYGTNRRSLVTPTEFMSTLDNGTGMSPYYLALIEENVGNLPANVLVDLEN